MLFAGRGVRPDHEQAARWFRAAGQSGVPEAQNLLAIMYYRGDGVPVDYAEAANWAQRSAKQGYAPGQADLAYLYEQGKGVPLDYVLAYTWYSRAAAGGERHSAARLKSLSRIMLTEQLRAAKGRVAAQAEVHNNPAAAHRNDSPDLLSFFPAVRSGHPPGLMLEGN
jgi:TPR repeat protein